MVRATKKPFKVSQGPAYSLTRVSKAADLDDEMLRSGAWKTTEFKDYNYRSLGLPVGGGYFHPLLKVRAELETRVRRHYQKGYYQPLDRESRSTRLANHAFFKAGGFVAPWGGDEASGCVAVH